MRIALAGSGTLGMSLLRPLLASSHHVVAILQNGRKKGPIQRSVLALGARCIPSKASVIALAGRNRIPVIWIDKMTDVELAPLRELEPDVLLVGGFSIILKPPLLRLPGIGCLNTHSSLLPKHRGPVPFSAAILSDDTESGVTFHIMEEGIDTGDIVEQLIVPIRSSDTALDLYRRCAAMAGERVVAVVDRVESEGLTGEPQDNSLATYDKKTRREEAGIDWSRSAEELERKIRGLYAIRMPHFLCRRQLVYVARATFDPSPIAEAPGTVIESGPKVKIATGSGSLRIEMAFSRFPIPCTWPAMWNRPAPGDIMG